MKTYLKKLTNPPNIGFKNKTRKLALLTFSILFIHFTSEAQFAGWPSSSSSPEVDVISKTVSTQEFLDEDRARVTAVTQTSVTPEVYELTVSPPSGKTLPDLNFPANKWCIVIQMEDNTGSNKVGQHCRVKVLSYNSGTGILEVEIEGTNVWFSPTLTSTTRVQVQRVPVYWDLDLNDGGELTCHAYNHGDGTGGIAALVVGNSLDFNGGIIHAIGKGYHYDWSGGPDLGIPGSGLSAPSYNGSGGGWPGGPYAYPISSSSSPNGIIQGEAPPIGLDNTVGGYLCSSDPTRDFLNFKINSPDPSNGQDGDAANNAVNPGTYTNLGNVVHYDPASPNVSSPWTVLRLGDAGNPGIKAGDGGGSGGFGGTGGNNSNSVSSPYSNSAGNAGGNGTEAAEGARGGGIVLIKMNTYAKSANIASNRKMIFVDGANGHHADPAGDGGTGGDGALGADGGCFSPTEIILPGGTGGFGESGIGAEGGSGGSGGACGTLWIMKASPSGFALGPHVSLRGGRGGGGGPGGYSVKYENLPLALNYSGGLTIDQIACNSYGWEFCEPPLPPIEIETCDCEEVFTYIGTNLSIMRVVNNSGTPTDGSPWIIDDNTGTDFIYFSGNHDGQPVLYYTTTSGPYTYRYNCYMYRHDLFYDMMEKMFKVEPLQTYTPGTGNNLLVGANSAIIDFGTGNVDIKYGSHRILFYEPNGFLRDDLTDVDDPRKPIVHSGNCQYDYADYITYLQSLGSGENGPVFKIIKYKEKTGPDGSDGTDEPDGIVPDNFFADGPAPEAFPDQNDNHFLELTEIAEVIQKPDEQIVLQANNIETEVSYFVYSMDGRLIYSGSFTNNLILNPLSQGSYVIILEQDGNYDRRKLIVSE
ncbi:T9SS type A sorting domain-containing protein [bacterium]|nr:T9SS type A sorting domain-containing protein [bacterium]